MSDEWKLTDSEREMLSPKYQAKYDQAVEFKGHDWARGPYGGWARGNDLLIELGWTDQRTHSGHRSFVTMVKPLWATTPNQAEYPR